MMPTKRLSWLVQHNPWMPKKELLSDLPITGISANSAHCTPGVLFVATKGATPASRDGHDYIDDAIANGAHAVVVDHSFEPKKNYAVSLIKALDSKAALSFFAEAFYDFPAERVDIIGITGTNGKTSTSFMLHRILQHAGYTPKIMGTLGMGDPGSLTPLSHTTMDPVFISQTLASMIALGTSHVIMEVSSHALSLKRVEALQFKAVALTNITQDHLDFHHTFQEYQNAKGRLFFELANDHTHLVLPHLHEFAKRAIGHPHVLLVGEDGADISRADIREDDNKTYFNLLTKNGALKISLPFFGEFHVKNACTAFALAKSLGVSDNVIVNGLRTCKPIPGRLQPVTNYDGRRVFVDYAHTPDALQLLLSSVKKLIHARLIVVFGCGGDRDRKKRSIMGKIASVHADIVIVTDDNPRSEPPEAIRQEILAGMSNHESVYEIADRSAAIAHAITTATKNDIVVIAGKGHENYQIYGQQSLSFSDYDEAEKVLATL